MVEWKECLSRLLLAETDFNKLTIALGDSSVPTQIPPIVRASISLLDKMAESLGRLNLMVLPDTLQTAFIFVLAKVFHDISQGKIEADYDPTQFVPGEKLRVGNAIVEYLGTEFRNGKHCLNIRTADLSRQSKPMELMPIFQKVATNRRLSPWTRVCAALKKAAASIGLAADTESRLDYVAYMKTHINASAYVVTSIKEAKAKLAQCCIDGKKASDIFYTAQVDYSGEIANISSGQMAGVPALVFAPDLYAVRAAAEDGKPVHSVIIDGSNIKKLLGQLDALNDLIALKIPLVCLTNVASSFELDQLALRGFNIWRWSRDNITEELYSEEAVAVDQRTRNCAEHAVACLKAGATEIDQAMGALLRHRNEVKEQAPAMMKIFEKLNNLIFSALRAMAAFSENERKTALETLKNCSSLLKIEARYLDDRTVKDYATAIEELEKVYSPQYTLAKVPLLKAFLKESRPKTVYLVVPKKSNKQQVQAYWNAWLARHSIEARVQVLSADEYLGQEPSETAITVVVGWLKRETMHDILYSFITSQYVVLLYDYENGWKNFDFRKCNQAVKNSGNKQIIEKVFAAEDIRLAAETYELETPGADAGDSEDELAELELVLKENKFRRYARSGQDADSAVLAIPVGFVGGYLSFYRPGHKVISASKVLFEGSDKIGVVQPTQLEEGDIIVVRESDKDLVRELADLVLANSGKSDLREKASKWRDALTAKLKTCTPEELYGKLRLAGCKRGFEAVKRWIKDEDAIAPKSKDDLSIIAEVTGSEFLRQNLDAVYEAATEVKRAHILAGQNLSKQLKAKLATELQEGEGFSLEDFLYPVDMYIEGIGNVKILRVTYVGSKVEVDAADADRLIKEDTCYEDYEPLADDF